MTDDFPSSLRKKLSALKPRPGAQGPALLQGICESTLAGQRFVGRVLPMNTAISPTPVKLDPELKGRLKRLATARHRAPHWLMREAIAQYVDREEKRQALHQDAVAAWQEYEETGLHVSGNEVMAWLETWGTDNEQSAPACHK